MSADVHRRFCIVVVLTHVVVLVAPEYVRRTCRGRAGGIAARQVQVAGGREGGGGGEMSEGGGVGD